MPLPGNRKKSNTVKGYPIRMHPYRWRNRAMVAEPRITRLERGMPDKLGELFSTLHGKTWQSPANSKNRRWESRK
jgi:hypothetical protein